MPDPTDANPMVLDRPDDVRRVRDILDRAGFDEPHILERMGIRESADLSFGPFDRARVIRRTRDGDPLATLIRTFLGGVAVPMEDFRRAVAPMDPAAWVGLGLVRPEGDAVRRCVVLRPSEGLVMAHDGSSPDGSLRRDHVMGVTRSTILLSHALVRPASRRTLDLGAGYLALQAAAHSEHVLGTDLSPRAVAMARFNARLNAVPNVEFAEGDLLGPAGDLRFDLIAANPPFVVSPEHDLLYRDSGMDGDAICERIIRGVPDHLAEGGFAQVVCNWVRIAGQDWLDRLGGWLDGADCDVWVIHTETQEPDVYAGHWLSQVDRSDPSRYAAQFDRWMAYYDERRIEAIDYGLINLRRRTDGPNWLQIDTERRLNHPNGAAIATGFVARDLLARLDGHEAMLGLRLTCQPELRLSQRLKPSESGWVVDGADCALGGDLRFQGDVNPLIFHLLTLCRGDRPLAEVVPQVAARLGQDPEAIGPACLEAARSLMEQGFLRPAGPPDATERPGRVGIGGKEVHAGP